MAILLLELCVIVFSLAAGVCWMASAYGHTITPPWKLSARLLPEALPTHQSLWNSRAAFCAAIAAIAQGFLFML
jgi:hypothetical protein